MAINIILDQVDKSKYSTFADMESMRESVNMHVRMIQESDLSNAWKSKLIRLLDYLRDHSRTFLGLSWKKQRTIAQFFGLSKPDTIGKWLAKLSDMGIVRVIHTKRSYTMQQTSNMIQILPVKVGENKNVDKDQGENGEQKSKSYPKTKSVINNTYQQAEPKNYYQRFRNFIRKTIGNDQKLVSCLFGIYKAHSLPLTRFNAYDTQDIEHVSYKALHTSIMATKHKQIKNLSGYFNGVLSKKLDEYVYEDQQRCLKKIMDES